MAHFATMIVNSRDQVVIRGEFHELPNPVWIGVRLVNAKTGEKELDIATCDDLPCSIVEHPADPNFILKACWQCRNVRSYDLNTSNNNIILNGYKLEKICKGPAGFLFAIDGKGELVHLKWRAEKEKLEMVDWMHVKVQNVRGMVYMEQSNILVITSRHNIKAINLVTGSVVWEFTQDVDDKELDPRGVCCDLDGRVYVADGSNGRIILFNGETGEVCQVLLQNDGMGWIYEVFWTNDPPQLTVLHGSPNRVTTHNITEK